VKRERLDFLADNPFYTKRFAYYVGRRCRNSTIKDVAKELKLDWHTVKELEKQYMRAQLARAGTPAPKRIGIDELSLRKRPPTVSWSAIWIGNGRSGSAGRIARWRV
jgi:transposase